MPELASLICSSAGFGGAGGFAAATAGFVLLGAVEVFAGAVGAGDGFEAVEFAVDGEGDGLLTGFGVVAVAVCVGGAFAGAGFANG